MLFELVAVADCSVLFEVYDYDLDVLKSCTPLNGFRIAYTMITSGALMNFPARRPQHGSSNSINQGGILGKRNSSYDWSSTFRGGSQDRDDHHDGGRSMVGEQLQAAMSVATGVANIR
jgi:hypothetical protein